MGGRMKYSVIVKPNSKRETVYRDDSGIIHISVNAPPIEGKANERVLNLLAEFLNVPKRRIQILKGFKGKDKLLEVL